MYNICNIFEDNMPTIREPIKKSSILKKKKIIEAGLEVFCTRGYHNTTTVDIAKAAGVSTGIVYSYFLDKKDILLQALTLYLENLYSPVIEEFKSINKDNLVDTLKKIIETTIESHKKNHTAHEAMLALSHIYDEVADKFTEAEEKLTETIVSILLEKGFNITKINEKIHIAFNLVEDMCHECVFHQHDNLEPSIIIDINSKLILTLLNEEV